MRISCTDREISLILLVPGDGKTQLREKILKSRREVKRVKQERKYIWFIIGNNDCKTYLLENEINLANSSQCHWGPLNNRSAATLQY